jgi:DNA-binding NarL/FixJ family response regulator
VNRFLLLGDHVLLLESLATLLRAALDADVRVQRLDAAAQSVNGWRPALMVVDSPDVAGASSAIRTAKGAAPDAHLLVIGPNEHEHLIAALRMGARGFLPRDCTTEQLVNCITAVLRGQLAIPRTMMDMLVESYVQLLSSGGSNGIALAGREPRILELLARGLSTAEIAAALYVSEGTIRTDIRVLLQKFGVASRAQLLTEALRLGLVPQPALSPDHALRP